LGGWGVGGVRAAPGDDSRNRGSPTRPWHPSARPPASPPRQNRLTEVHRRRGATPPFPRLPPGGCCDERATRGRVPRTATGRESEGSPTFRGANTRGASAGMRTGKKLRGGFRALDTGADLLCRAVELQLKSARVALRRSFFIIRDGAIAWLLRAANLSFLRPTAL
jgi:hypothetical protein